MPKAPSRKSVFWFFGIPTTAVLVLLGGYLARIFYYQHQIGAAREALCADGAPMTFEELAVGPPLPDEENAALALAPFAAILGSGPLNDAIDKVQDWDDNDENHPGWLAPWEEFSQEERDELTLLLGRPDVLQILAATAQAVELPGYERIFEGEDYWSARPGISTFQGIWRLLILQANQYAYAATLASTAEDQETAVYKAYETLLVGLKLVRLAETDRRVVMAMDLLNGIGGAGMLIESLEAINREWPLPDSLYNAYQAELAKRDFTIIWQRTLDAERVIIETYLSHLPLNEQAQAMLDLTLFDLKPSGRFKAWTDLLNKAGSYLYIPVYLRLNWASLLAYRRYRTIDPFNQDALEAAWLTCVQESSIGEDALEESNFSLISTLRERLLLGWTLRQLAATGLAVNAYADDHDGLPPTLEALVPDYLPQLPVDPFAESSAGFHYVPEGEQFRLWALGQDGIDDGGTFDPEDWDEGDLVFRGRRAVWTQRAGR
jgi:hypothetical protein